MTASHPHGNRERSKKKDRKQNCTKCYGYVSVIQKMPEKLIGKARNQGTIKNNHIGHRTHAAGSANVKVQNIQHGK
jgi:patatin-like phospholipase/acyl hydrolase